MSILIRFDALLKTLHILFNDVVFIFYGVGPFLHFFSVFLQLEIYVSRDCEQCLLFFRFSKGNARARPRPRLAAKPRERSENRGWQLEKKKKVSCLSRRAPSVTGVFIYVSRAFRSWCCDELSDRLFGPHIQDSAMV